MKIAEFKLLSAARSIRQVVFMRTQESAWHVYAFAVDEDNELDVYGNQLMGTRGEPRTYTSLDRAYEAIRAAGYAGIIVIDR